MDIVDNECVRARRGLLLSFGRVGRWEMDDLFRGGEVISGPSKSLWRNYEKGGHLSIPRFLLELDIWLCLIFGRSIVILKNVQYLSQQYD